VGDELLKDLSDLLERLLLQQSHFFCKFLLCRSGLSTKGLHSYQDRAYRVFLWSITFNLMGDLTTKTIKAAT